MSDSPRRSLASRLATPPLVRRAQQPVTPPIVQTTTFHMDDALNAAMDAGDYHSEFLYTRMGNPTVEALQHKLADLHGAHACVCTASGMGAISAALFGLVEPGDTVVADTQLYGVTSSFLRRYLEPAGRHVRFVDLADTSALDGAARAHLAGSQDARHGQLWVLAETISNPLVQPADIPRLVDHVHALGGRLMIDNTFAGPTVCRPLALGADVVIESLSKCIAGHSDVHGGAVLGEENLMHDVWQAMLHFGACLDPHAAWLILRGLRTLHLRAEAAASNAATIAAWLTAHPEIERVYYPVADEHAHLHSGGHMLSFVVKGGDERAQGVMNALQLVAAATSLGGTESLASLPFNTSHRSPEVRAAIGLLPGTVRLSVGIEAADDLIDDLKQALSHTS